MSILEVEGLSMSFDDKQLYKDASFRLNKEDHMGIIGQNGAGKSTLIKILTGPGCLTRAGSNGRGASE